MTWQQCKAPFSHSISRLLSFWPPVLPPMVDKSSVFLTRATVIHSLRPRVSDRWKGNCEENPISISHPMDPITIHTVDYTSTYYYYYSQLCRCIKMFIDTFICLFSSHPCSRFWATSYGAKNSGTMSSCCCDTSLDFA